MNGLTMSHGARASIPALVVIIFKPVRRKLAHAIVNVSNCLSYGRDRVISLFETSEKPLLRGVDMDEVFPCLMDHEDSLPDAASPVDRGCSFVRARRIKIFPKSAANPRGPQRNLASHLKNGPDRHYGPTLVRTSIPAILSLLREGAPVKSIGPQMIVRVLYDLGVGHRPFRGSRARARFDRGRTARMSRGLRRRSVPLC